MRSLLNSERSGRLSGEEFDGPSSQVRDEDGVIKEMGTQVHHRCWVYRNMCRYLAVQFDKHAKRMFLDLHEIMDHRGTKQ